MSIQTSALIAVAASTPADFEFARPLASLSITLVFFDVAGAVVTGGTADVVASVNGVSGWLEIENGTYTAMPSGVSSRLEYGGGLYRLRLVGDAVAGAPVGATHYQFEVVDGVPG